MKFVIKHEIRGRIRVHLIGKAMSFAQADTLQYQFEQMKDVTAVKVQERTMDVTICYIGSRKHIITALGQFSYDKVEVPEVYLKNSGREMNRFYWDKLVDQTVVHFVNKIFLPAPLRAGIATVRSVKYIVQGVKTLAKRKIEVPVLDATAISVSLIRGDYKTAGAVMFLLSMGEILEEWTHKKSVGDLARSLSLNIDKVWLVTDDTEVQVSVAQIKEGDRIRVHMGAVIPFDGIVMEGEALVNQASLTGESLPVRKAAESPVYAGTVVEEGEITLLVKESTGSSKYEKIMTMIEDSEKLKSSLEGKAEHLADRLVPYTFLGTGLTLALTRNTVKALSVLMVDFSCALKLAMPLSVLSAIRESSAHDITVKGGKFLEAVAEADTIVFDKTGTLTKAQPTVVEVIPFDDRSPDELLRIAACLEEHFPHSMATAVVVEAMKRGLVHEELHTKVEYIVAHGISSTINDKKIIIGSHHFVFEDEGAVVPEDKKEQFEQLPEQYSHLYMAMDGKLVAVICIEDPLREEAVEVIRELRKAGLSKIVMMTGDSERTAKAIAKRVGVDEYYAEVLPEDKAEFCEREKAAGRNVIMIGDGINDSPALSAANVGIAISDGAEIAREIADITVGADNLKELVTLKKISNGLIKRISHNYHSIVGFNAGLIALGVAGIIMPTTSALLHNTSTLIIGLRSMQNLLDE